MGFIKEMVTNEMSNGAIAASPGVEQSTDAFNAANAPEGNEGKRKNNRGRPN